MLYHLLEFMELDSFLIIFAKQQHPYTILVFRKSDVQYIIAIDDILSKDKGMNRYRTYLGYMVLKNVLPIWLAQWIRA